MSDTFFLVRVHRTAAIQAAVQENIEMGHCLALMHWDLILLLRGSCTC